MINGRYLGAPNKPAVLLDQARQVLLRAEQRGQDMTKRARQAVSQKIRQVRNRAIRRGMEIARGRNSQALTQRLLELEKRYHRLAEELKAESIELALHVAEEVLADKLPRSKRSFASRIERGIEQLVRARLLKVRALPQDVGCIKEGLGKGASEVVIEPLLDAGLSAGDCILETSAGSVRLVWRDHLAGIKEHLLALGAGNSAERGVDGAQSCAS